MEECVSQRTIAMNIKYRCIRIRSMDFEWKYDKHPNSTNEFVHQCACHLHVFDALLTYTWKFICAVINWQAECKLKQRPTLKCEGEARGVVFYFIPTSKQCKARCALLYLTEHSLLVWLVNLDRHLIYCRLLASELFSFEEKHTWTNLSSSSIKEWGHWRVARKLRYIDEP